MSNMGAVGPVGVLTLIFAISGVCQSLGERSLNSLLFLGPP